MLYTIFCYRSIFSYIVVSVYCIARYITYYVGVSQGYIAML